MDNYENIEVEDEIIDTPEVDSDPEEEYSPDIPEDVEDSGESEEDIEDSLTDRLDALIEILTPEESDEEESVSDTPKEEENVAALDPYSQDLLESINATLFMIKSENVSYHSEMLVNQEEAAERQEHISESIEILVIALFVIGFFVALSCGRSFADTFFNRMRG